MKRLWAWITSIVLILILAGGAAIYWYVRAHGFSARGKPSVMEAFIARRLRAIAIPSDARDAMNPVAATPEVLAESMAHFADHCASCHANDGSGDTAIGRGIYPKPPDMRRTDTQNLTDGELYYIIHNGVRFTGMPGFGEDTSNTQDLDSWKLVHFIRRLPKLTAEEVEQMKEMNPKSPADLKEEEELQRFLRGEDPPAEPNHVHH
jgi:mono/diheme cytochrome c family protein